VEFLVVATVARCDIK